MAVISNGTTVFDAGALGSGVSTGALTHIKTLTASADTATMVFTHGTSGVVFNNTYDSYLFKVINLHPENDGWFLNVDFSINGSDFDLEKLSNAYRAQQTESASAASLAYVTAADNANAAAVQPISFDSSNDDDHAMSGELQIFAPSDTTFVKHYTSRFIANGSSNFSADYWVSGFINTTSAITTVKFLMAGGDFDSGEISLYGVKG